MKISILTLFPDMFKGPFDTSIIKRAVDKNQVIIEYTNLRDFGKGRHKVVDDTPYGGGVGMIIRVDVVHDAIKKSIDRKIPDNKRRIILMSAQGRPFTQKISDELSKTQQLIIICGHYEGIDRRIEKYIDDEVSIGDFVTTGGEIPSMLIIDSVVRRIDGVLKKDATLNESFQENTQGDSSRLEHDHYTKPPEYDCEKVPEVLMSGNHKLISEWRKKSAEKNTVKKRPDLIDKNY
jgi:tRNA (guanine37-N1)-methyltransferase